MGMVLFTGLLILPAFSTTPAVGRSTLTSAVPAQITVTPEVGDASEIGSTDGILVLGVLITLLVIAPVLLRLAGRTGK